jgi:hypothetical protein
MDCLLLAVETPIKLNVTMSLAKFLNFKWCHFDSIAQIANPSIFDKRIDLAWFEC